MVLDADQAIAKKLKAKITPEVIVLTRDSDSPIYQGAIDNLYADYGKKRKVATESYLSNALNQYLTGQEISVPKTKAIGCFLSFDE